MVQEQQKEICFLHQHSFRFYCLFCQKKLCSDCFAFFHDRTHLIILLSNLNNPELKNIYFKLQEIDTIITDFEKDHNSSQKSRVQIIQEMKENDMKYLDMLKEKMSAKYDEIIDKIKESNQSQTTSVNKLKEKQRTFKQTLRSLKTSELNYQNNINSLSSEIDSLKKEYGDINNTKCNSISIVSLKEWSKRQEMIFKFDNYKKDVNSKNVYHIGFCDWKMRLREDKGYLNAIVILDKKCLTYVKGEVQFIMNLELVSQKEKTQMLNDLFCSFSKNKNEYEIKEFCNLSDVGNGFDDENGYVEILVTMRFKNIEDFLIMQEFGVCHKKERINMIDGI